MKKFVFSALLIAVISVFGFAWLAQLIYNATVPGWLGWPEITYWQMFGIIVLLRIAGSLLSGK